MNNLSNPLDSMFDKYVLERGAMSQVSPFLQQRGLKQVVLVADSNTYEAAGKDLEDGLRTHGLSVKLCLLTPDAAGDVVADEATLVELMLQIEPGQSDMLLAVGSGTIHDIVRFASHKCGIPFISVPTAPSVDGFASSGAPLVIRGVKTTVPAAAPIAIFADTEVLMKAPQRLVAAGFGDMLAKYTSLFDWKFSSLTGNEPYHEQAASMTEHALKTCVEHVQEIGERTEQGITVLMSSLMESGAAMMLFGKSHPASGAEHHLSHYWEMEFLHLGRRALLHGAKVGVACAEISRLYHAAVDSQVYPGQEPHALQRHADQIRTWLMEVPDAAQLRELLRIVGGPSTLQELGVDGDLYARSVKEAHRLRDRHTLLRALQEA